ncbi:16S rRNA (cytosine(1402)-N(4))-methyltransferase RsmH [Stappia sp. F7233]|uniref:Ribosomal RNA small subunit methyltransferase H n=1 Tax=Stappia albiluteola TaxID=2758565 RepID=A0A839AFV2_9HYPH|nr:16S rRNA (cytosine(1402)-N(4))-methyltransferase RsmH [Stappia albiluteola]MBA5777814.1 16S rRNA (cytosine(1402)-N(4))-methyltransferase RsmH [Stappia albiluteola]
MSGPGDINAVTGNSGPHIPVMLGEVLAALDPRPGETVVDGTFGAGGYTRAILGQGADVIAIDRDPTAIAGGAELVRAANGKLKLVEGRFSELDVHAAGEGAASVDGVVLDLGVSSMQLDQAERGFSFRFDGPLDMRMGRHGPTAADVVNTLPQKELTRVIGLLGEERRASAVSSAIAARRAERPFARTGELAQLVERVLGRSPKKAQIHPATRTFQALRIYVNGELEEVAEALGAAERALRPGGRLVVVTFHSLEDRIVKRFFADRCRTRAGGSRHMPEGEVPPATFEFAVKGAVESGEAEIAANPRARSAKLRAGRRLDAPAREIDFDALGVPRLGRMPGLGG